MKSDEASRSTSKTESETQLPSSAQPRELRTKNRKNASVKSIAEDKTETHESTAHAKTPAATPIRQPAPTAPTHSKSSARHRQKPISSLKQEKKKKNDDSRKISAADTTETSESTATTHGANTHTATPLQNPAPSAPIRVAQIKTPMAFFVDSIISPTSKEELPQRRRPSGTNHAFLKKVDKNIDQIESDQSDQFSWIRKLVNQKWMTFLDTFLAGFTLLFFTIAFYFIFHINPTLELKLTPEFRTKVRSSKGFNSFEKCNHFSWLKTDNSNLPVIDDNRCFNSLEYGRVVFETFKSSTPDASDGCKIDRVEIHPCYTKTGENDPMNIFWGFNNTEFDFICNGSVPYMTETDPSNYNLWSFNPPVSKYAMLDKHRIKNYLNRIVSSTAFFFQCPKCNFMHRFRSVDNNKEAEVAQFFLKETAPSIPRGSETCYPVWDVYCDLYSNPLIQMSVKPFSQQVLPFTIVLDPLFKC